MKGIATRILAVTLGVLAGTLAAEIAFRAVFAVKDHRRLAHPEYRLMPIVYGQFDPEFGQRFVPGSHQELTLVRNGRAVWCSGTIAKANVDGLGGRDTLEWERD